VTHLNKNLNLQSYWIMTGLIIVFQWWLHQVTLFVVEFVRVAIWPVEFINIFVFAIKILFLLNTSVFTSFVCFINNTWRVLIWFQNQGSIIVAFKKVIKLQIKLTWQGWVASKVQTVYISCFLRILKTHKYIGSIKRGCLLKLINQKCTLRLWSWPCLDRRWQCKNAPGALAHMGAIIMFWKKKSGWSKLKKTLWQRLVKTSFKDCIKRLNHWFLIEVDCSLVIKHTSKLNGVQTIQMSQVFFSIVKFKWASFEYSITREQLLIYGLHDESTSTYLWVKFAWKFKSCCKKLLCPIVTQNSIMKSWTDQSG
jgi:hypothetical protein